MTTAKAGICRAAPIAGKAVCALTGADADSIVRWRLKARNARHFSEAELAARQVPAKAIVSPKEVGWLSIYQRTVQPLPKGAVLLK